MFAVNPAHGTEVQISLSIQKQAALGPPLETVAQCPETKNVSSWSTTKPPLSKWNSRCSNGIVLCTGFSTLIDDERSKTLGIDGFVMKPVIMKGIATTIRNVLDQRDEH